MFCQGQELVGKTYENIYGDQIYFFESGYDYRVHVENYSNNFMGAWNVKNDTIYLDKPFLDVNLLRSNHSRYSNEKIRDSIMEIREKEKEFAQEEIRRVNKLRKMIKKNDTLFEIEHTANHGLVNKTREIKRVFFIRKE